MSTACIYIILGLSYLQQGYGFRLKAAVLRRVTLQATATEQYLINKRAAEAQLKEERIQRDYHKHLDAIADGDPTAISSLGGVEKWLQYAADGITLTPNGFPSVENNPLYQSQNNILNATYLSHINETLDFRGFAMLSSELFDWAAYDVDMQAIAQTMSNLVAAGWPSVFIFLYDQPWKMCLRLFDLMAPILNDEEATLEASLYAWALERQPKDTLIKEKVGGNFGSPHRDITYKNCHATDGSPDILSLWIPLVDVSADNGCMMVVPRECDPQFALDKLPKDQDPFSHRFQYASIKALAPITGGTTLVWHPNLIHWGSACSFFSELPPRKSIAMAFRVCDARRPSTDKEIERYGRVPFSRQELQRGGPGFQARLRMIVKSLILYNVWYPTYDGLAMDKIDTNQ